MHECGIGGCRKPSHGENYIRTYLYDELVEHVRKEQGNIVIEKCARIMREYGESKNLGMTTSNW